MSTGRIVDVGALEYEGGAAPIYAPLRDDDAKWSLLGFDPLAAEAQVGATGALCLPHAIGDGTERVFKICNFPMTSSLLEPNTEFLKHFEALPEFCEVVDRRLVSTQRLDDVAEAEGADFIKIDVQSATLMVLDGGVRVVSSALAIHTELDFAPIYRDAPSPGQVLNRLQALGFELHHFHEVETRRMSFDGMAFGCRATRAMWSDAVFFPNLGRLDSLSIDGLVRLAIIANDCYGVEDFAYHCLRRADAKDGGSRAPKFERMLG